MQSKCDKPKNKQLSECCLLRKRDSINNKQLSKCCFLSRRHMTKNKQLSECRVWSKRDKTINKQLSQCYLLSKHDKVKNNHYFRRSFFKKKNSPQTRITVWTLRTEKGVVTNTQARDSVRAEQNVLTKWSNANLSDADDTDNGHQSLTLSHTHQPEADGLWKWLTCACH